MRINGHGISDGAYSAIDLLMAGSNTKIYFIVAMVTALSTHDGPQALPCSGKRSLMWGSVVPGGGA